jgi:shikimate dehydrogenase
MTQPEITGHTRVVGVIAHPVEHTLSPPMHNAEFRRLGLDWVYVPWDVLPENLPAAVKGLRALGVAGFNVTIPHKQAIMPLLDRIEYEAEVIGAVNTVTCTGGVLTGFNTDMYGWQEDIQQDISLEGRAVCLLGVGGAARAVSVGAYRAGAPRLVLAHRPDDDGQAEALAAHLREKCRGAEVETVSLDSAACSDLFRSCQVVVNATPVGMASSPGSPVPADWLHNGQYLYDVIYTPAETELMRAARAAGCRVRGGLGMLARQGAMAFKLWTGTAPDPLAMEATLRQRLGL